MPVASKFLTTGGAVLGGGAAAAGGTLLAINENKTTIGEELNLFLMDNIRDFENKFVFRKKELSKIFNNAEDLKNWCKEQYQLEVTTKLTKEKNGVWEKVKNFCTFTVRQRLSRKDRIVDLQENWEVRARNLKSLGESYEDSSITLEKDLEAVQDQIDDQVSKITGWEKLKEWCEVNYKTSFLPETINLFSLVQKFCTKASIREALRSFEISTEKEFESDWNEKIKIIKDDDKNVFGSMVPYLKKGVVNSYKNPHKQRFILQKWCRDQYSKGYDSKTIGNSNYKLLDVVAILCTLRIWDKLGEKSVLMHTGEIDSASEQKFRELKSYSDEKPKLTKSLRKIKDTIEAVATGRDEIEKWCSNSFSSGYRGEEDNLFLLVKKFCVKNF